MQGGKSVDRAEDFSERVVFETAGEGEEGEDEGLQGVEGAIVDRLLGKNFHVARDVGGESTGIEKVSGQKKSGLERLTSRALGGEEWGKRGKGNGIEKGLDTRRRVGAEVIPQTETNGFAEKKGEGGGRAGAGFFKGKARGGKNEFEAGIANSEPSEVLAGGEKRAGLGDKALGIGQLHRFGKEGETKTRAEMF